KLFAFNVLCLSFFFFFQAEDGIRVFHVTGVQTCALPIYALVHQHGAFAVGAAQLVLARVRLDHRQVAPLALRRRGGLGRGSRGSRVRLRALLRGQRALHLGFLAPAARVDLGAREVGGARRQRVAADAVAVGVVPAIQLLLLRLRAGGER